MKTNATLFWILAIFFFAMGAVYTVWNLIDTGQVEWAGTVAIPLAGMLSVFLAFYMSRSHKAQGGELAEDRLDANIDDGDPELGHFSPWSWWPIILAFACGLIFLAFAVGMWIIYIGGALVAVALVGWVYEYYRGNFVH
ncbi:cytochrome c oxidase subunit 4 [Frigoribacterium sp. CFBP9039]|uniref:cytochrome c oxidase subunit 4 n=1 Tax=unclassified Frigoribacterium TaxID=2627005 RepID=UPI00177DBFE1|nr:MULTISPECIES: cytochrome c oxidase subunit 4 [unclassified Frigoribacterium]MBD8703572.1 cytochrome c oxidase subunit 4 [Frigoribacterium sp. CFBP 13712]MDY0890919.1 cytochrome c oxidase subunit 4 [Frigoribacterium sp. CFBP9030]MDY0945122.1 cytochrome c oxidase subunit 4 [Frigoribacterium sp. CFBP9039]